MIGDHKVSPEVSWLDSVPQDEYRSQVVDVLANTMNNCLAELGYHPDFTQQLQTIHEWNIRLRNENAKLFQDNKKLAQLIGMQNERISKTVPNIPLNQGVADLQIRLQAVELNRQELLNQHHAALEEIGFLRQEVARLNRMLRVRLTSTSGSSQVPVQTQVPPQTHIPVHTHISQTGFLPMYDGNQILDAPCRRYSVFESLCVNSGLLFHTALETYKTWFEVIAKEHWVSFPSHVMLYHGTHPFLIRRCWKITGKNHWLLALLTALATSTFAANIYLVRRLNQLLC
ncbi:predicted protein [Postia placenta Mad-698-R]|nr:predicted protein [Postia placenta Mad-698-R]